VDAVVELESEGSLDIAVNELSEVVDRCKVDVERNAAVEDAISVLVTLVVVEPALLLAVVEDVVVF